jgi:exonuclease SbcC
MVPLHLKLRNFMSYRDEAQLDFSHLRIACLAGDNGAGKSALLDAVTWAIWGKARTTNDRELVALGESEMEVTFCFRQREREYRIFRRRAFGSRMTHALDLAVRVPGDGEWTSIAGDNVRQTEQKIVETLNLDYDTFVNSAFILQGKADSFTEKKPAERKKVLADILSLNEYDELAQAARDEQRGLQGSLQHARQRISILESRLVGRPALLEELDVTSFELNQVGAKADLAEELLRALDAQLQVHERIEGQLAVARARHERDSAALATIEARISTLQSERSTLLDLLGQAEQIERGAGEYERWRAVSAELAAKARDVQQIQTRVNAAEREIDQAGAELERVRERQIGRLRQAQEQLARLTRAAEQIAEMKREAATAAPATTRLDELNACLDAQRGEAAELNAANTQLKQQMADIKERMARLEAGEATCPVCRTPLSPADRARICDEWTTEGTRLGDLYRANRARLKDIDRDCERLSAEERDLNLVHQRAMGLLGRIAQLETEIEHLPQHEAQVAEAEAEIARLDRALATGDFAAEPRARLSEAQAALLALAYDPGEHQAAEQEVERLRHFDDERRALEQARSRLANLDELLASLIEQEIERHTTLKETEAEIGGYLEQLAGADEVRERAQAARDESEALSRQRTELWERIGGVRRKLEELDDLEAERRELAELAQQTALDIGALGELVTAFGRNGIQAMIVENVLPELEDEANALLRRMASSQLHVSFRTQREALSTDSTIETLDIIIRDEYGERPYALYSGGEAFRVNFAVRVALSKLLARRAGAKVDVLVIDEGFGTQDSRGRDGLIEALRSVEEDFQTILVITHIGEIRELFPARIDIVKTERGSMIYVN